MEEKSSSIILIDESGQEHKFDVLFTFDSDETNKSYIVYTDHEKDDDGKEKVYASVYDKDGIDKNLYEIETEAEWDTIFNILKSIENKIKDDK